jgi:transposase
MVDGEWYVGIETPRDLVGCGECGAVARVKDRRTVTVRDLPAAGVPVVIRWRKRIFECRYALCFNKTWTEQEPAIASRAVLTDRARQWGFGRSAGTTGPWPRSPRSSASAGTRSCGRSRNAGNRWSTTRDDSTGCPLSGSMRPRSCGPAAPTRLCTRPGIADLTPGRPARLLDVVAGRSGTVLSGWLAARDDDFRARIAPRHWIRSAATPPRSPTSYRRRSGYSMPSTS